jgi:hypothetical protein
LVSVSLSNSYVTYTPTYNSGNPTESSWVSAAGTYSDFASVAYISVAGSDYGQTNTFLNDAAQNTDANYAVYKGDICQYLSKTQPSLGSWRMPTAKEYNSEGLADNAYVSWSTAITWASFGSFGDQTSNVNAQGTTSISSGGTYTVNGSSSSYPASGFRVPNGTLLYVGLYGRYWSSSVYSSTNGYYLYFSSSLVGPALSGSRQSGFVVRCVQN